MRSGIPLVKVAILALAVAAAPLSQAHAMGRLQKHGWQCVTYARHLSPVKLFGDAWTWWQKAAGKYDRGSSPKIGSILVFQKSPFMRHGHVAVVRQTLNEREILVEHANWAPAGTQGRGQVTQDARVIDVSPDNDWTDVRVWYDKAHDFGRVNQTYGFIYSPDYDPETGITWDNG